MLLKTRTWPLYLPTNRSRDISRPHIEHDRNRNFGAFRNSILESHTTKIRKQDLKKDTEQERLSPTIHIDKYIERKITSETFDAYLCGILLLTLHGLMAVPV